VIKKIALAGENYNPQRATWSDGAYKSAIHLLNKNMDFQSLNDFKIRQDMCYVLM
jgi:hypothetical protein